MYEPREPKPGTVGAAARLRARTAAASLEERRVVCESLRVSIAEVLRKYRVYPYELDGHEVGAGAVAAFEASR